MEDFLKYYKFPEEGIKINYMPQFKEYELEKIFSGRPLDYATKKAARIYLRENKGLTNEEAAKSVGTSGKAGGVIVGALKGTWKNRIDETLRKEFKMGSADIKRFKGKHFSNGPSAEELKLQAQVSEARRNLNVRFSRDGDKRGIIDNVTAVTDGDGQAVKVTSDNLFTVEKAGVQRDFAGSVQAADDYGAGIPHSVTNSNFGEKAVGLTNNPSDLGNGVADGYAGFGDMGKLA